MPNAQDLAFVQLATASGLAEFTEGQIAISKSLNPAVRDFGQQMVTDHTAAGNQLSAIAAQEQIPVLTGLEPPELSSRSNSSAIRNSLGPISTCKWSIT